MRDRVKKSWKSRVYARRLGLAAAMLAAVAGNMCTATYAAPAQQSNEAAPQNVRLHVVAFGDSLLDAGTYSPVVEALFGGGRFTTNPAQIFVQHVANHYGDSLRPAYEGGFGIPLFPTGGLDYAQGGSRVKLQPGVSHAAAGTPNADFARETTIPVADQLSEYLRLHHRFHPNQLVFIDGGANDILFNLGVAQAAGTPAAEQAAVAAIEQSATDLVAVIASAVSNGATHVVVLDMPDIGKIPAGAGSADGGASLTQISGVFNQILNAGLQSAGLSQKVTVIDAFSLIDGVIANFGSYGFTVANTATACSAQAEIAKAQALNFSDAANFSDSLFCSPATYTVPNADQTYMFADSVHPSAHLSKIVAEQVEQALDATLASPAAKN